MQTVMLGRTGLPVSVVGLGCGGHSRLGMANGADEAQASRVVARGDRPRHRLHRHRARVRHRRRGRRARSAGAAIRWCCRRKRCRPARPDLMSAAELRESLELSLDATRHRLRRRLPSARRARRSIRALRRTCCCRNSCGRSEAGKVRFIGITERFGTDTNHAMLERALPDDHFDVIMVGHNLLNPSARRSVFPLTRANDVGTLIMFAVRRALTNRERVGAVVAQLIEAGAIDARAVDRDDPLGFVASHRERQIAGRGGVPLLSPRDPART